MTIPLRMLYISVIQVILTAVITYYLVTNQYRELSENNVQTLETFLISQKEQELKNYTAIALSSVEHMHGLNSESNQQVVEEMFKNMLYNDEDGYFFIYDDQAVAIVHPKQPDRVGKSWWDLEDDNGDKTIQILLQRAHEGGGFYRYNWLKPSENDKELKLSYSVYSDKWKWMLGTGVYLDDVYEQLGHLQKEINNHLNNTKQIILIVALSSIFFIFLFGFAVNLNHKKRAEEKISQLGQRVIDVQEEENRHIARELHDGIIQILVSIKYSLEATSMFISKNKQEKPAPLIQAEESLKVAIQEVRRISHHMHPQILDELGLSDAIESIASDFSKRTNVKVKVIKPVLRKLLPDFINTTLFRVVQESLTNIQKHANARNILIEISINNTWLTMMIKDDGIGFDVEETNNNNGIGLRNLVERVEHHLGTLDVESSDVGTVLTVKIPTASFVNHFNDANIKAK
ncbi:cache domain-containing protein [Psychromonas algicola]|uniref:cache domain-containing protein n=1 Tax=Psychromonas algicola TaxID=2555642 RepID=UPI0010681846|nr:cache domain-containing protein [Psychromonas sp. RZ5]TEW51892.1 ATPase [Psychromonas sp. RZ5]